MHCHHGAWWGWSQCIFNNTTTQHEAHLFDIIHQEHHNWYHQRAICMWWRRFCTRCCACFVRAWCDRPASRRSTVCTRSCNMWFWDGSMHTWPGYPGSSTSNFRQVMVVAGGEGSWLVLHPMIFNTQTQHTNTTYNDHWRFDDRCSIHGFSSVGCSCASHHDVLRESRVDIHGNRGS